SWIFISVAVAALIAAGLFGLPFLRRAIIAKPLMRWVSSILPQMGDTERTALEAGTVWWDGDLFSGTPDWKKLLDYPAPKLSEAEQAFLDGPVEELCAMADDWRITQDRAIPPELWDFMKKHRFLGMVIPEKFGGLGFSALGHSAVVTKLSSRSSSVAVTVMVPNSLGPGELLMHYGTDEQKAHYLPRLASGDDIPCFALTEPTAGSDAAATTSIGVVCRGTYDGEEVLGIRLNWTKRYITLAPVATVIGLAFRLMDPDGLLGSEKDLGITCALIPRELPGIDIGNRHDPMGVPFQNGPIFGKDVFVPLSVIIGEEKGIGQGWRMLMEALAAGRSISLPSLSVGAAQLATRVVGAYGTVREQFNMPIGRFEGIEEVIGRIGGLTYLMNAARTLTCSAVDAGEKPAVLTGIVKAYLTDGMRTVLNDAMDIQAGAAICRGPKNILGRAYVAIPVAITVEGANILTRSLIIYGQGAIRSHPFVRDEVEAVASNDLKRFDRAFFGHVNFACRNLVRVLIDRLTAGRLIRNPANDLTAPYFRQLSRSSTAFALVSDVALAVYGGSLKRREMTSGRLADALSWLYLASVTLKRFHDEGRPERDNAVMRWGVEHALLQIDTALRGVLDNLPNRALAMALTGLIFGLSGRRRGPSDHLTANVARALLEAGPLRDHLTSDIFIPPAQEEGLGRLEATLQKIVATQPIKNKLREGAREGKNGNDLNGSLDQAIAAGVITSDERDQLRDAEAARLATIQVDAFDPESYDGLR
ncbi:MAG: acyl-CoA dehydrogenase, partial [Rhodospirillaceae bacterium]|nr:acyl-CoA dehydrogenase [Rhodospirillaceae bacterium]